MINPLFFPHSCLFERERDVILSFFEHVSVFRSFEPRTPDPCVDVIVPVSGGEDHLKSFLNEYKNFAALNIERASAFLSGANQKPLFDSTWAAELRSEIVRCMDEHSGPSTTNRDGSQELLWARAFIEIAHDYDEKNRDIDRALDELAIREKKLFDTLMGGDGDDPAHLSPSMQGEEQGSSEIRLRHRLLAWATLFVSAWPDENKTGGGFYLTHNRSVIQELEEYIPSFHCAGFTSKGELTREELDGMIRKWVSKPYSVTQQSTGKLKASGQGSGLTFYIAPDLPPCAFFNRVLKINHDSHGERPDIKNTVIGLVET